MKKYTATTKEEKNERKQRLVFRSSLFSFDHMENSIYPSISKVFLGGLFQNRNSWNDQIILPFRA